MLIQGASGVAQYEITADQPSLEGRAAAMAWGGFGGLTSSVTGQLLTEASASSAYWSPSASRFVAPETARTVTEFRMTDTRVIAGVDFFQSLVITAISEIRE